LDFRGLLPREREVKREDIEEGRGVEEREGYGKEGE